jgi:hypothetical protein
MQSVAAVTEATNAVMPRLLESERNNIQLFYAFLLDGEGFITCTSFWKQFGALPERPLPWIAVPN